MSMTAAKARRWDRISTGPAGTALVLLADGRTATVDGGPHAYLGAAGLAMLARTLPPRLARQCRRARRRMLRLQLRQARARSGRRNARPYADLSSVGDALDTLRRIPVRRGPADAVPSPSPCTEREAL